MLLRSAEIKPAFIDLFSNENITYDILLMGRRMLLIEEEKSEESLLMVFRIVLLRECTDGVSYQFTDGVSYQSY